MQAMQLLHLSAITAGNPCRAASCRHGDKHLEMALVPFEVYAQAAEKLIDENPLSLKRVAFVSSEDPDVIARAANLTRLGQGARAHLRTGFRSRLTGRAWGGR